MAQILCGNVRIQLSADHGNRLDRSMPVPATAYTLRAPAPVVAPFPFMGRDAEVAGVREAVTQHRPIEWYGECGSGVSTLLRFVASASPGVGIAAPYHYLRVGDDPLPDVVQRIVAAAYDGPRDARPLPAECAHLLAQLQAVVVLDDVRCSADVVRALVSAMPHCCLVIGGPHRALGGPPASMPLAGIDKAAALALLDHELGRSLGPEQRPAAGRVWAAVGGQPLRLRQAACLVRAGRHSFADLAAAAERDPQALDRLAVTGLTDAQRRAMGVLALVAGALLPADLVAAMGNVADARQALKELFDRGLAEQAEDRFALPVCQGTSYRAHLQGLVDAGAATRDLTEWLRSTDPASHLSASVAEAALTLLGLAAERGEWLTVVRLVRVIEPILMLAGRWQTCAQVLGQGFDAAVQANDVGAQAYFAHQQGTLALCEDRLEQAQQLLGHALRLREQLGDVAGAQVTQHNLTILLPPPPPPLPLSKKPWLRRPGPVPALTLFAAVVAVILGIVHQTGLLPVATGGSGSSASVGVAHPSVTSLPSGPGSTTAQGSTSGPTPGPSSTAAPSTSTPGGPSTPPSSTPDSPTTSLPPLLPVVADKGKVVFGEVDVSKGTVPGSAELTVTNPNQRDVVIAVVRSSDPQFVVRPSACTGSPLPSGATCTVSLSFAPTALGSSDALLTIETQDVAAVVVDLHGVGYLTLQVVVRTAGTSRPRRRPGRSATTAA